ncbi:hypothetical protein ACFS2C_06180 [Prauserella oleivorans]|uniref:Uncharacterized protein n=1 Tax=Prauserella oleivorans TaxID=1478153 RepID=A0ABW5W5X4_9PSEU
MSTVALAASTIPATARGPLGPLAEGDAGADVITPVVVTGIGLIGTTDVATIGGVASSVVGPAIEVREHASVTELVSARSRAISG